MALFSKLFNKLRGGAAIAAADWEELEHNLIESDLGAALTEEIIALAKKAKAEDIESAILATLSSHLATASRELQIARERVTSIIVVGVNGTGKTTSVAKLMKYFKDQSHSVIVAAADTFRAAAIDQIQTWGERIGVPVVVGKFEGDPASVAFDGIKRATSEKAEIFIVDTAGRLHTKSGLMDCLLYTSPSPRD